MAQREAGPERIEAGNVTGPSRRFLSQRQDVFLLRKRRDLADKGRDVGTPMK